MTNLQPHELTADDVSRITTALDSVAQDAIVVRPHQDNSGIFGMDEVLRSLPRADTKTKGMFRRRKQNTSAPFAFEMRYAPDPVASTTNDERVLSLQYVGGDERTSELLGRQLPDKYPDSRTEHRPASWLTPDDGQHIAVVTFGLRRYTLYPLKNVELDEFRNDPTGSILTEMVGAADAGGVDADVAVQVMARPAGTDWQNGVSDGYGVADTFGDGLTAKEDKVTSPLSTQKLRWFLNQETYERRAILPTPIGSALGFLHPFFRDEFEHPPSKADKQAAKMLSDLDGRGWEFHVRIVAVSDDPDLARERVASTAEMFDNFYEYRGAQTFIPIPQNGSDAIDVAMQAAGREWPDNPEQRMVKPQIEVAGLTNIPEAEHVSTNKLRWALASPGEGIPPGTPRFDFEAAGVDREASQKEKQIAMIDSADVGDPYWYGWGKRHGIEAGVYDRFLNAHQFVGGRTRMGKTVALTNFTGQAMRRFHDDPEKDNEGGLIIDPKGQDGDEFIAEWPDDRPEEDVVVVDLGDEDECIPRFNLLEIPSHVEPDTREFDSYTNAVADVVTMMVAEAGGSDNYVGSVMKRVTRTLARGLLRANKTCTFLDLAAAASYKGNFEQFSEWMQEDRIAFIAQAAERMAQDDKIDLNPLAGRFDEYVQSDSIRSMISARDATFSIQDAVDNGKWIALLFTESAGKTEVTALSNAYIAATYLAKLMSENEAPFHLIGDEVHNFTTSESMLPHILSQGGGLGYRCTLACQSPANQLPGDTDTGGVKGAVQDNIDIWNSFKMPGNSSRYAAAQYRGIDASDLEDISRYSSYLVQYTEENEDIATLIDTFPPIREVREEVLGEAARTQEDIDALKKRSMERYGEPLETAEEQAANSHFFGEITDGDNTDNPLAEPTQLAQADPAQICEAVYKAVWDESIRQGDPGGWINLEDQQVLDRLADYTPGIESFTDHNDAWRKVIQPVPNDDPYLDREKRDDGHLLRVDPAPVYAVGTTQNDGGPDHIAPLQDAYVPLTQLGFVVEILEQTSDAMPDGLVHLDDVLDVDRSGDGEAIAEAMIKYRDNNELLYHLAGMKDAYIETEHTTGSSQPSQTVENLAQAANAGHRCLFLSREETAKRVYQTLGQEPFGCWSTHHVEGKRRFYTGTQPLRIDGEVITRPGASDNVWVHDEETDEYILRDTDGTVHARFDSPAAIFEDVSAYPAGGERNVMPPAIPEYEIDGDLDAVEWDVMIVPEPETDEDGNEQQLTPMDLRVIEDGQQISVPHLLRDDPPTHYGTDDEDTASDAGRGDDGAKAEQRTTQAEGVEPTSGNNSSTSSGEGEEYLADDLSNIFN